MSAQEALDEIKKGLEEERYALTEKYWRALIAAEIASGFMPLCVCEDCGTIQTGSLVARILKRVTDGC